MKKFVEESILLASMEIKTGKFSEDADVQIHKKPIHKLRYDNSVD
jgi:hypothetical protein